MKRSPWFNARTQPPVNGRKMRCMNADAKRSLSDLRGWRNALIYGLRGATSPMARPAAGE